MRLAEALSRRSYVATRMAELRKRANSNAQHQEGTDPIEDPHALLAEYEELTAEFETLVRRINATNMTTELSPGVTLTDALAQRDSLRARHRMYTELADAATAPARRYSRSEIRQLPSVDVRELRQKADDVARQLRELDSRVQELNWATEVGEE
ncbi:DIP1984 family protein [Halostreptopolyspora alba]|uniref:DIP1984 family protein n=1 Tax=Halostreptopolyspora alba TaxID=2487137 RepID=A0A3N0E5M6_9ACTN|nr:hypothetical protein EFW17_16735 [Nocardiopsaceae bacterium YIM 96095]